MAKYLVTGGAGFIGSNIVEELVNRNESVRVLDNLSAGRLDFWVEKSGFFLKEKRATRENIEPFMDASSLLVGVY